MLKSLVIILAFGSGLGTLASQAQDAGQWAGFYAGLTASSNKGDMVYDDGGIYDLDGTTSGLMLGYNYATGPWVIGAELAYAKGRVEEVGNTNFAFESSLDLKGRAGYAISNVLLYGTLGGTFTKWDEGGNGPFDGDGLLLGVGVDYLVSPQFFIGAEYVVRDVTSDWNSLGSTLDANVNTVSLRAGLKF